ncbi:hypothetical protein GE09DRAFT_1290025 [Coniochaeta sp. 2T2.1]|nr:hypothetical protein GE09DRAFT_1290025 [Coniochaeta sp. 2T2.1]
MLRRAYTFLRHLVNALIMTSIFSIDNGLLFATTRTLHGMSLGGHAPRFFLPLHQVNSSSAKLMNYLVYLITCCQLINYGFTAVTDGLPYKGRFQPYTSYFAMGRTLFHLWAGGYTLFLTGGWDVMLFFLDYGIIGGFILAFLFWKFVFKSKYVRPGTADLSLGGLGGEIYDCESMLVEREQSKVDRIIEKIFE